MACEIPHSCWVGTVADTILSDYVPPEFVALTPGPTRAPTVDVPAPTSIAALGLAPAPSLSQIPTPVPNAAPVTAPTDAPANADDGGRDADDNDPSLPAPTSVAPRCLV
jgi:hypothetical protein